MKARIRALGLVVALAALVAAAAPAFNVAAVTTGNQGCTPGYWKNHTDNWEEYSPTTKVGMLFGSTIPQANDTFLQALNYGGGSDINGARQILLRAAVASTLNAAHEGLGFAWRRFSGPPAPSGFVAVVKNLLAGTDRAAMISYAAQLDKLNNSGCPLN